MLRAAKITGWKANCPVAGYRVDVGFPKQKVALEVDGFAFHSDSETFTKTASGRTRSRWRGGRFCDSHGLISLNTPTGSLPRSNERFGRDFLRSSQVFTPKSQGGDEGGEEPGRQRDPEEHQRRPSSTGASPFRRPSRTSPSSTCPAGTPPPTNCRRASRTVAAASTGIHSAGDDPRHDRHRPKVGEAGLVACDRLPAWRSPPRPSGSTRRARTGQPPPVRAPPATAPGPSSRRRGRYPTPAARSPRPPDRDPLRRSPARTSRRWPVPSRRARGREGRSTGVATSPASAIGSSSSQPSSPTTPSGHRPAACRRPRTPQRR